MAPPPPDDKHECAWQEYAKALAEELTEATQRIKTTQEQIDSLKQQYEQLRQKVFGKSSEKG